VNRNEHTAEQPSVLRHASTHAVSADAQVIVERLTRLQAITSALSKVVTPSEVAEVIIGQASPALGAEVGVVALLHDDGKTIINVAFTGVPVELQDAWRTYPLESPVPVAEAIRTGLPVFVRTRQERNTRFPALAEAHGAEHGGAVTALPLIIRERVAGCIAFCFPDSKDFAPDECSFLLSIAEQCAQALERSRLFEQAQQEINRRKASEARLQAIIDNVSALVYVKDREGRYQLVNQHFIDSLGIAREKAIGNTDSVLFESSMAAIVTDNDRKVMQSGEPSRYEESLTLRDGPHTYISLKSPLRDDSGQVYAICGVSTDITERKRIEETLREGNRQKDEFLATLAHELRNPMAPIRTAAYALNLQSSPDSKLRQLGDIILRQVAHMSRLIDDLLDVSRISRGQVLLRKDTVDLVNLVELTVADYRSTLQASGLSLELALSPVPLRAEVDATRIAQALSNLLHNARKFTPSGGHVRVELSRNNGHAVVLVADNGRGISPQLLDRMFQPFVQGEQSLDRSFGGLGLGLALVKGMVELHGGKVAAYSDGPGKGARFTFALPLHAGS